MTLHESSSLLTADRTSCLVPRLPLLLLLLLLAPNQWKSIHPTSFGPPPRPMPRLTPLLLHPLPILRPISAPLRYALSLSVCIVLCHGHADSHEGPQRHFFIRTSRSYRGSNRRFTLRAALAYRDFVPLADLLSRRLFTVPHAGGQRHSLPHRHGRHHHRLLGVVLVSLYMYASVCESLYARAFECPGSRVRANA